MIQKCKNIVIVCLMAALVFGLAIWGWVRDADEFSESERRVLAQFPELSAETVLTGDFMKKFETYSQDQFPMRETFRTVKALSVKNILMQKDNNGLYVADGHASKIEYPLSVPMLDNAASKFQFLYDSYMAGSDAKVYLSIIPDKNYFLAEENGYLAMDYTQLFEYMRNKMPYAEYIDITGQLEIGDYYTTDSHWKQECIIPVADALLQGMGASSNGAQNGASSSVANSDEAGCGMEDGGKLGEYTVNVLETPFYGVYKGQTALPLKPDTIKYLTSGSLDQCKLTSYDTGMPKPASIYDMSVATGRDPYEMFMSGSDAILVLENPNAETDRELIIFRDSFGSSITPLLAKGYAKITLVDIRYVQSQMIGAFVDFTDQDVLFLYSTTLLNNSTAFK